VAAMTCQSATDTNGNPIQLVGVTVKLGNNDELPITTTCNCSETYRTDYLQGKRALAFNSEYQTTDIPQDSWFSCDTRTHRAEDDEWRAAHTVAIISGWLAFGVLAAVVFMRMDNINLIPGKSLL